MTYTTDEGIRSIFRYGSLVKEVLLPPGGAERVAKELGIEPKKDGSVPVMIGYGTFLVRDYPEDMDV